MAEIEKDTLRNVSTVADDATNDDSAQGLIQKVFDRIDLKTLKTNFKNIDQKELVEKFRAATADVPESTWYGLSAASALSSTILFLMSERKSLATVFGLLAPVFLAAGLYKKTGGDFTKPARRDSTAYH